MTIVFLPNISALAMTPLNGKILWESDSETKAEVSGIATTPENHLVLFHRGKSSFGSEGFINENTIVKIDPHDGKVLKECGTQMFKSPHGLHVDNLGNTWVTDTMTNKVYKLDSDCNSLKTFGDDYSWWTETCLKIRNKARWLPCGLSENTFARPTDVTTFSNGDFVVADGYRNSRIVKFNSDGKMIWEVNSHGGDNKEFKLPHAITSDNLENIYVADRENKRIQVFNTNGKWVSTWDLKTIGKPFT